MSEKRVADRAGPGGEIVVWRMTTGRAGHDKQAQGLDEALARLVSVRSWAIRAPPRRRTLLDGVRARFPAGKGLPPPTLILGAGHATHLPMLCARRAYGGRVVVLMKPTLPTRWFDLCLIPEHDRPVPAANVVPTMGAMNRVVPDGTPDLRRGLVLIGGPSRHYSWEDARLLEQVRGVLARGGDLSWIVADSPRTPDSCREAVASLCADHDIAFHPFHRSAPDWLDQRLAERGTVWVTEDSVSMIFEAVTAGAAVGLLEVPRLSGGSSRVPRAVDRLVEERWVTRYTSWAASPNAPLPRSGRILREADRCAALVLKRLGLARCP